MAKLAKFLQGVAGAAGGAGLNVEDVFSTYLYDGNSSTQTITNGIDLSGEGGLVWTKVRTQSDSHYFWDTERGVNKRLSSNNIAAEQNETTALTSFNSNGFTLGSHITVNGSSSDWGSAADYCSWTFRKAPKFFDVVTWSGNSTAGRAISHNLGTTVGAIFVKEISDNSEKWRVYHRSHFNSSSFSVGSLNESSYFDGSSDIFNSQHPSSTEFYLGGSGYGVNESGETYVAYLFAHNDGDGEFGPTGDQDIIKCGSFTKTDTGISNYIEVDLGFEAQWILSKVTNESGNWQIWDVQRGLSYTDGKLLQPNSSSAESNYSTPLFRPTPNGFAYIDNNATSNIYIAIRRGPMAVPESATDVFDVDAYSGNSTARTITTNFPVDLSIIQNRTGTGDNNAVADRLRGKNVILGTNTTSYELTNNSNKITAFDNMSGVEVGTDTAVNWSSSTYAAWNWKRAPSFCDVVAYDGNNTAGHAVPHNLGVTPEMVWVKERNDSVKWYVFMPSILGTTSALTLNDSNAPITVDSFTAYDETNLYFSGDGDVNGGGSPYIAYLFASLDGVSKVGSYTGTGSNGNNVDCGFSNGARFVLIRRVNGDEWMVFDTARGITSANNDPKLALDNTGAENQNSARDLNPLNSGFTVNGSDTGMNKLGDTYIFYAIA